MRPESEATTAKASATKKPVAEELSRYGIEVSGFDLLDADESALADIVAAVAAVVRRHPFVTLRRVAVAPLPAGEWSRVTWVREEATPVADEVVIAASAVIDPGGFAEQVEQSFVAAVSGQRPVFSAVLRAMGHVVDVSGGFAARGTAHRELVAANLAETHQEPTHGAQPSTRESMARTVREFRRW